MGGRGAWTIRCRFCSFGSRMLAEDIRARDSRALAVWSADGGQPYPRRQYCGDCKKNPRRGAAALRARGHSMGGYIAFEIMRQAPERVAKLALINTQARSDIPEMSE